MGLEIYGSPTLWNQFNELVLKGFLTDKAFLQKLETDQTLPDSLEEILRNEFKDLEVKKGKATGTGDLFRFNNKKWQGISLNYQGNPVHLYATKEQVDILKGRKPRMMPGVPQMQVQSIQDPQVQQQEITLDQVFDESE